MINDNNNHDEKLLILFKQVFNNIVLLKLIYQHVYLFKKNEYVKFKSKKELLEYKDIGYVQKLKYDTIQSLYESDVDSWMYVNELEYGLNVMDNQLPLSKLPSTIHTVKNITILKNKITYNENLSGLFFGDDDDDDDYGSSSGGGNEKEEDKHYTIPSNITSISFKQCTNISDGYLKIPNTVKELIFNDSWKNEDIELKNGDLPNGLIKLSMMGYNKKIGSEILPVSIKDLKIKFHEKFGNISNEEMDSVLNFDFLPLNLESLYVEAYYGHNIIPNSNLIKFNSIKKLTLNILGLVLPLSIPDNVEDLELSLAYVLKLNVIPQSVKNLKINFCKYSTIQGTSTIENGSIPDTVESLIFSARFNSIDQVILPKSLKTLQLEHFSKKDLLQIIPLLPKSLNSITLKPVDIRKFKIKFPETINKINYI